MLTKKIKIIDEEHYYEVFKTLHKLGDYAYFNYEPNKYIVFEDVNKTWYNTYNISENILNSVKEFVVINEELKEFDCKFYNWLIKIDNEQHYKQVITYIKSIGYSNFYDHPYIVPSSIIFVYCEKDYFRLVTKSEEIDFLLNVAFDNYKEISLEDFKKL